MKQILLMIVAAAIVGCGKNEDGRPQSDAKAPSPTTSTKPEPQAKPKESTEEEIPLSEYDKELIAQAESGDADAQWDLAVIYKNGEGVEKDFKEAVKWYRKAAEQGDVSAQGSLGLRYQSGEGVPEDEVTAYAWYNIAAANGHANSKKNKADIAKSMTPGQIAKGEALAKEMTAKNPKLLQKKE